MIKEIIIYPGSFAPITIAHYQVMFEGINKLAEIKNIKTIEILCLIDPVSDFYNKESLKTFKSTERIELIKLGLKNFDLTNYNIEIDTWQIEQNKWPETIQVRNQIEIKYKIKPILIFGEDIITNISIDIDNGLKVWPTFKKLFDNYTFLICKRSNSIDFNDNVTKIKKCINCKIIIFNIDEKYSQISSTLVRKQIKFNKSNYIFENQYDYIKNLL